MRFWDWAADTFIKYTHKYQVCVGVLRLGGWRALIIVACSVLTIT